MKYDTSSANCHDITLSFCPTWTGMLPAQGSVPAMEYHVAVEQWQAVLRENEQLRQRIAALEQQVQERGMKCTQITSQ